MIVGAALIFKYMNDTTITRHKRPTFESYFTFQKWKVFMSSFHRYNLANLTSLKSRDLTIKLSPDAAQSSHNEYMKTCFLDGLKVWSGDVGELYGG